MYRIYYLDEVKTSSKATCSVKVHLREIHCERLNGELLHHLYQYTRISSVYTIKYCIKLMRNTGCSVIDLQYSSIL